MSASSGEPRREPGTRAASRRASKRVAKGAFWRTVVLAALVALWPAAGTALEAGFTGVGERTLVVGAVATARPPATPTATATPASTQVVPLSVLSDSHAYFAASWWRQTVEANAIPGVSMGAFASQPGAVADTIASGLDEAAAGAQGGYVLVQAGTNDLLAGSSPARAASDIEALWAGVRERGSTPIAVLVPPSSQVGSKVIELNRLLTGAARQAGIAILDVYTPVADAGGRWLAGTSDDGKHANLEGATRQANEVLAQLPGIIAGRLGQLAELPRS
ncbi:GDSL-type esterase/lipase family protein [Agreia pratensis]|uniref:GDSL-like Lipase/Acylhydrolase family protein n=1 Tax=Agreia pratensis TaxID=150121 RepID=A0A1X7INJ2_9MICO|nr:GDSL-type esterase/lipase family protein [Agreia pratensis]SMG16233.1 GDSL-like Lipase/Acylhydrolase family protein [Agreia pratensis]